MSHGSVTYWLNQLRLGDPEAAKQLWDRYYVRVVHLARSKLRGVNRSVADEEDVAAAAFNSFYAAVSAGVFVQLNDRSDLWQVLVALTCRKATDQWRRTAALKRGGDDVVDTGAEQLLSGLLTREPDPTLAVMMAEEVATLLDQLPDDELELRRIAVMKLEGFTNTEIGATCQCSLRTVERRICLIRKIWGEGSEETPPDA